MVGAYREESTDQWTAASGITTRIAPLFNELTSWFKYEELTDDWLDLTLHEVRKHGPALKNGLVGDADMYKERLNRESLRAQERVANVLVYRKDRGCRDQSLECCSTSKISMISIVRHEIK